MMYIPREKSPWEQYLPQMLTQLALMKVGQNFQAKQAEVEATRAQTIREQEFGAKVGLAGGKEVSPKTATMRGPWPGGKKEVRGTPQAVPGQRRFTAYGKTFEVPMGGEEILRESGIVPLTGGLIAQQKDGKWMITKLPKEYQPGVIENVKTGEQSPYQWGEDIPSGWKIVKEASTIVNVGQKPASASERTAIASGRASIDSLQNLNRLFNKNYVGPIVGRVSQAKDVFGLNPQDQSEFMAATTAFKNAIIKEITGAQMSEAEAQRIMKQVPDITDAPTVWKAKWNQSIKNLRHLQNRRLEILEQSGLTVPGTSIIDKQNDPAGIRPILR